MRKPGSWSVALLAGAAVMACLAVYARAVPGVVSNPIQAEIRAHVAYLASDALEGRLVGTPGIEAAAAYIAEQFRLLGLEPAFDGSYYQDFIIEFGLEMEFEPVLSIDDRDLAPGRDFQVLPISGSGTARDASIILAGKLPPDSMSIAGAVVLVPQDGEAERRRWTMIGRDGLLDWMTGICAEASSRRAAAVVFVSGSPDMPERQLHTFAVSRSLRSAGIPAFEVTYAGLAGSDFPEASSITTALEGLPESGSGVRSLAAGCRLAVEARPGSVSVRNVGAIARGTAETDRYIVVGAHYDHLGYGDIASSTPWRREVHNGADDNASGVAALLGIARALAGGSEGPARSIALVCFTAEELGALGSEYFCEHAPFPMDSAVAMINLDTVGRLEQDRLIVFGARSATEFGDLLASVNRKHRFELAEKEEIYGFSDQNPFYARGIPAMHLFTGAHSDYHSPDDDVEHLNMAGLARITVFTAKLIRRIAWTEHLTPVIALEQPTPPEMSRGAGAFLGIIPDFTYAGTGVGIRGTVPRSPAEAAGLADGDVILSIDGKPISDLQGLMVFLAGSSPGDRIEVRIMRGSLATTRTATLSVRSPKE